MASAVQSVDDLVMCLVSMGFGLEDSQQAVQAGKLSVEEAIEWILQGKPGLAQASLTLRKEQRGEDVGANPFANPQPLNFPSPAPVTSQGSPTPPPGPEEDRVTSRMSMNDKQRQIKEKFHAKEREEARKSAIENKKLEKKAKAEALKQIEEDRERRRMRTSIKHETTASHTAPAEPPNTAAAEPTSKENNKDVKSEKCILQIRLPTGQALRHNFTADTLLAEVWNFVKGKLDNVDDLCLIQPFPRQEYGEIHMCETLCDLGLTPSGSLVVKKADSSPPKKIVPADSPKQQNTETQDSAAAVDADPPLNNAVPLGHNQVSPPTQGHSWGAGNQLEVEEGVAPPPDQDVEMADDSGDDEVGGGNMPPGFGGGGMGGGLGGMGGGLGGMGGGLGGMGGGLGAMGGGLGAMGGGHQGQDWGEGNRLVPENHNSQPDLPAQQLAAEAARRRYAGPSSQPISPHLTLTYNVTSLTNMIIKQVSTRICDGRNPLTTLSGLPSDVATRILEHLIKEKILRPKTLHPFVTCHLQKLILDCYPYTTNELIAAISLHKNLQHLSMCFCPLITDRGLQPLAALKRLKVLNLGSCNNLTNNCLPVIANYPSLVTLVLEETHVNDQGIQEYCQTKPENLQHLNLCRTPVTHKSLQYLADLPRLRTLNLEQTKVCSLTGIDKLESLEGLNISGTAIVTESLMCLLGCSKLISLNISNTENVTGDLALQYISGVKLQSLGLPSRLSTTDTGISHLKDMPLQSLDLTNYINVTSSSMQYVGQIHSLKKLLLGNTKITDEGLLMLAGLTNLTVLSLDRTAITDAGATIIQGLTQLQELSMSETAVSSDFLCNGVLNNCLLLSKLNLSRTAVSNRGVRHIHLPHLSLINLDGTRVKSNIQHLITECPQLVRVSVKNLQPRGQDSDSE